MSQRFVTFLLNILLSGLLAIASTRSDSRTDFDRSFPSSPGKTLSIDLRSGGDITISGTSGNTVNVKVRFTGDDRDEIEVKAEETASGVEIRSEYADHYTHHHNGGADVEVEVPSQYNVSLKTMGGAVSIKGVEGEFDGTTMGGEIRLQDLTGKVKLTTMGGEIEASNSNLDGELKTMGGDVILRNVSGNVQGSTMGGDVRQEGTGPSGRASSHTASGGEKKIHSMGGDLNLDSAPDGASLETMGGEIHIGSAADHVKAKTMGGDIRVDSIDGWADLTTMGGDVTVNMVGDPSKGKRDVDISSMGGDIELTLPAEISATFDLQTEFTTERSRIPKIVSDFPVNVTESSDCRYDHDRDCKILVGSGKTGSGANRIKIRTIQGDIIIKKR